ncbi:MAG: hypothetical protein RLZZ175_1120 [Bacteroidota bacterium]|jgi:tetratricopeptide (TPR) repeat protein
MSINKYILILLFSLSVTKIFADNGYSKLDKADSLFTKQKYTKALNIYEDIFQNYQQFTPRMLVKMSFIHESMGNYSRALYLLNLYNDVSPNRKVLEKLEQLASQNNLSGYDFTDFEYFLLMYYKYYDQIIIVLLLLGAIATIYVLAKRKIKSNIIRIRAVAVILYLFGVFYLIQYHPFQKGIVNKSNSLLMSSPSAASTVLSVLNEGNRLQILDKKDIWYKVSWQNQNAYIREGSLLIMNH